jgi:acetyl esterase/lipase
MTNNPKDASGPIDPPTTSRRAKTPAERVMPPVVYRLPGMDAVTVHSNLKYSDVDNPFLLMDIYTPPRLSSDATLPVVMLIHGGACARYKPKDWGFFQSWGRLIAASGMAAVMFTHRLGYPKPCLTEAALDVNNAIDYVRSNAASFNADPDRIGLVAWSAGGPLLSAVIRQEPPFVRCLLAFYAYLDIQCSPSHMENESSETLNPFRRFHICTAIPPRWFHSL